MTVPRARVDYAPVVGRPPVRWPNGARVAVWVVPNVEHFDLLPPGGRNPALWSRVPPPDVTEYAVHDGGNRVGLWRLAEVADERDIRYTVSLNVAVLDHYPEIAELIRSRRWAVMAHGIYNTRLLYGMTEAEERAFYADCRDTVARHLPGVRLKGMFGPAASATERTPDLMAEAGFVYHADWAHDDQPVPLRVARGRLVSMPYALELQDGMLKASAGHSGDEYEAGLKAQFDRLYAEGGASGRVMAIPVHPHRVAQPHFIAHLRRALSYIVSHEAVWWATGDEIAEHFLANHYDDAVAFARRFRVGEEQP